MATASAMVRIPRTSCSGHLKSTVMQFTAKKSKRAYVSRRPKAAHLLEPVPTRFHRATISFIVRSSDRATAWRGLAGQLFGPTTRVPGNRGSVEIPAYDPKLKYRHEVPLSTSSRGGA